jgi:hypothetical protein
MNKDNIIIYVSSRNNYDMLEGEVLKNIDTEGFEFINVDDGSSGDEIEKGKTICKNHDIVFLENKSRGVQMATQTLIDFINKSRPNCKWIICFQHDTYPLSKEFFSTISNYIDQEKLDSFGILGFNIIDSNTNTGYTPNGIELFKAGKFPIGIIGMCHLSVHNRHSRWLCPSRQSALINNPEKWKQPFIVEFPNWCVTGINILLWNKHIIPTTEYQFHLWLPDIAMQFNYANHPCITIPSLHATSHQQLKTKYGIDVNSAHSAKAGNSYHFGEYSNFDAWKERWGWYYEDIVNDFEQIKDNYKGTLIWDFYHHDINNGPLKSYKF